MSVSVIITILNGVKWIDTCFQSIICQTVLRDSNTKLEICVFDDASEDQTFEVLEKWQREMQRRGIRMKMIKNTSKLPRGVGYGRNVAISEISEGTFLCFQDIDDVMDDDRIKMQLELAKNNTDAIIGSKFVRSPENSTCRFSKWANDLGSDKLETQIFTSHGPTVIMPTWFCHRQVFNKVGGFSEEGKGTPEDLIFFYKHLDLRGKVLRVDSVLLNYRYHQSATTFSISESTIWKIRLERLIRNVLSTDDWKQGFTIWNAGKQGRRLFRDLPEKLKSSVLAFCDVDIKKIKKSYQYFDRNKRKVTYTVPIVHFTDAITPIVICVKLDLTNGAFEKNLQSLNLVECQKYVIFS